MQCNYQVSCNYYRHIHCSYACAVNLETSVVITGGSDSHRVTEYSEAGYVRDLPPLQDGRYHHGCSYYDNAQGTKVCDR